ncbi:MAG TPA: CoA transferase [Pseudomonadales bacterium]|nr:CoA transferase [Pseudomonadales bacterium]
MTNSGSALGAQALAGLKVLDIGGTVATAYCGKLFAAHGADVIDVEPPGGAATRALAPYFPPRSHRQSRARTPNDSVLHAYLSANKRSVALDIAHPAGRAAFVELVRDAAVVLDASVGPRSAFDDVFAVAPSVVVSRITWFGQTGPYRDYAGTDSVCHALIGMVRGIGPVEGPPALPSGYQAQIVGGLTAYIGTLGHVIGIELGNRVEPCVLDTSIFEANTCFTDVGAVAAFNTGTVAPRMGVNRFPPTFPLGIYPCRDGWIGVTALTPSQWAAFGALLDLGDLTARPEYRTTLGRLADAATLEPIIMQRVAERSAEEIFHRGQALRIPLALVPTMEQLFTVDQYVARAAFGEIAHPVHGAFKAPVTPFRLYRTPAPRDAVAPTLGQHTRACLAAVGVDARRFDDLRRANVVVEG